MAALRRAGRRPPRKLVQATEAFFGRDYATALELLADDALDRNPRVRPHVCLLRAATRHTLWLLGGQQDDTLVELAVQDVAACAELGPIEPSPSFFSPRFVDFHSSTLKTLAEAAEATAAQSEATPEGGV